MAAVWLRFRAELGVRWRAWLGLALLVGFASGAALAFAAGARRTDTAYSRFLRAQRAYDVAVLNYPDDETAVFDFDEIAGLPQVADAARGPAEYFTFNALNVASADGRIGTGVNRFKMLEGRAADPREPGEIVVGFALAEKEGLRVGDTARIGIPREFIELVESGATTDPSGEASDEDIALVRDLLGAVPDARLEIVGVEAAPGEFPPQFALNRPLVHLTPAMARILDAHDLDTEALMVRLRQGSAGVDDFLTELEQRAGGALPQVIVQRDHAAAVNRSIHFQAVALWLLAGLTVLAATMIVAQLLARLSHVESGDYPTLRALGMGPGSRFALGVLRAAAIGVVGAAVGAMLAAAASGLFPTGLARTAEPRPGFHIDVLVLGAGAAATAAVVILIALWPAWRAARQTAGGDANRARRASWVARTLERRGAPAPATVGVHLALETGRGATSVPVRSTIAGVALGVAALVGALTFGASLTQLRDTPRLYGQTWDLEISGFEDEDAARARAALRDDPRVVAFSGGQAGAPLRIDGERVGGVAMKLFEGDVSLPVLEGRAPEGRGELALGARTLRQLDVDIGDAVDVAVEGSGTRPRRMRVVGVAVFPTVSETAKLGEGALVAPAAVAPLDPSDDGDFVDDELFVRLEPGTDPEAVLADLNDHLDEPAYRFDQGAPTDIVNFGRVEAMPLVLGGVLAAISAASLAHLLLSAVGRRRRDLAVLKTLGFVRGQVGASVAVQATTVAAIALLVGVPAGIALGRLSWSAMADSLGVVSQPQVPVWALVTVVAAALVLANLIAWFPARLAARTPAASGLRSE
jgi:ABC-type lipoprotein release transport system permease subunit